MLVKKPTAALFLLLTAYIFVFTKTSKLSFIFVTSPLDKNASAAAIEMAFWEYFSLNFVPQPLLFQFTNHTLGNNQRFNL